MSLLQFIIIIAAILFILFWIDLYKRKKMNILHFIIFLWWWAAVILFAFNQTLLNSFWSFFWIARGADLLVYIAIILIFYFYFWLLNQHTKDKYNLTRLISTQAINECFHRFKSKIINYKNTNEKDDFIFNIRVYNEDKVIGTTIDEIIRAWFKKILCVNDGSNDNSINKIEEKISQYPDTLIMIASHTINRWGGAANQTWYNFIKKYWNDLKIKWFVWFDADGQMDIKDMETFTKTMNSHKADLYLWSRFIEWSKTENMSSSRKFILLLAKLVSRILYSSKVSDPHSWYRVINLESLRKINLTADWMHYANELNEQINRNKMKYIEVPVHIKYTEYSLNSPTKGHRNKNSDSIKLGLEMLYKKIFFR